MPQLGKSKNVVRNRNSSGLVEKSVVEQQHCYMVMLLPSIYSSVNIYTNSQLFRFLTTLLDLPN